MGESHTKLINKQLESTLAQNPKLKTCPKTKKCRSFTNTFVFNSKKM